MVVERDPHVRELQTHFLEEAGYLVTAVVDGHVALELAMTLQPSVIVTEVLVPRIDGLSLCRQLKANNLTKHIPVVVLSILAASTRAKEAGADAFLMKPLAKENLLGAIHTLVHAHGLATPKETFDQH
jgi:CheY-like chemotaxis protein